MLCDVNLRQGDVISRSCSICTPALVVCLELIENDDMTQYESVAAQRSPPLSHKASLWQCEFSAFYRLQSTTGNEGGARQEAACLPARPPRKKKKQQKILLVTVTAAFTLTSPETVRLTTSKNGKEKLRDDKFSKTRVPPDSAAWIKLKN